MPNPDGVTWLVATSIAIILCPIVLDVWTRQRAELRGRVIAGCACALFGGLLVLALVALTDVPTGWITVLQEGRSIRNVRQLYGSGTHAGPGFAILVDWLSGHGPGTLPVVVRTNLSLAVVNVIVFLFVSTYVLRSWWAGAALTAVYACNPSTLQAAFSETPAMVWTLHVWLACIAAAVVADHDVSRGLRFLALVWLGDLVVLATWLRPEALVLGVPALIIGIAHVVGAEDAAERAVRAAGRALRSIVAGPLSAFLLVGGGLLALEYVPVPAEWRYAIAGLRPLNFAFLTWMQTISLFFPFAILVLFALGVVHGVRKWFALFLFPISVLTLFKVYASGSHGAFLDKIRYLTFVTPLVLVVALFGFRELSYWAGRFAWPAWWKRIAVLLLVATFPAWNPWPREFFGRRQQLPGVATPEAFLARNQQTEVRYLLDLVDRYPRCVFVTKTPLAESAADTRTGSRWSAFGKLVGDLRETEGASGTVELIAAGLAPDAACILFYRSMDCDLVGVDDCRAETNGRTPLEERVLENLPYSEVYEYGAHRPEIHLGVYPIVVRDQSAVASAK